jgi:hypothetical protein
MKLRKPALLAAIAFSISVLVDGAQSKQEEQDYTGSVLKTLAPDEIVQVMVMHKNNEGKKEAASAASTIVGEIPRFKILVATLSVHSVDGLKHEHSTTRLRETVFSWLLPLVMTEQITMHGPPHIHP